MESKGLRESKEEKDRGKAKTPETERGERGEGEGGHSCERKEKASLLLFFLS